MLDNGFCHLLLPTSITPRNSASGEGRNGCWRNRESGGSMQIFFYPDTFIQTDDLNYWSRPIKSRSFYPDLFIQSWSRPLKSRPFYPDHVIQFWSKFSLSSFLIQSLNPDPWSVQIFVITASHPRPPLWSGQEAGVSDLSQGKEIDNSFIRHPFLTFA